MRSQFEVYRDAMHQTRLLGILGASIVCLCVICEGSRFFIALSANEVGLEAAGVRHQFYLFCLAIFIGILAFIRIRILWVSSPRSYLPKFLSWWLLASVQVAYVFLTLPADQSSQCDENGVCFGTYDMRDNTDFVAIAGSFYLLFSLLRFASTAIYSFWKPRYK